MKSKAHLLFKHILKNPNKLKYSDSIIDIRKILKKYKHSLKFVFVKRSSEKMDIIDCLDDPSNLLCNFME